MTGRNRLLVFLRTHNEVDQTTPVLYKLGERGRISADVVVSADIPADDYRISAIDSFDTITIYDRGGSGADGLSFVHRQVEHLKELGRQMPTEIPEKLYKAHVGDGNLNIPGDSGLNEYSAIAFDWSLAKHYRTDYLAESDDVTTIVLPHGDSPFGNRIIKEGKFRRFMRDGRYFERKVEIPDIGFNKWTKMMEFDYVLFPNWETARRITDPATAEKIKVLGSPRYNREWLDILSEIRPTEDIQTNSDCNVVVFLRTKQYFISKPEVEYTLQLLSKFSGLSVIVKEHPRNRLLDPSKFDDLDNIRIVKDEIQSATLIDWGDVFLSLGTTITFEPVMRHKPVLALEYAHANQSIISQYFSNADMRCKDDLYVTVHTLLDGGISDFFDEVEHEKFVEEMITSSSEPVLDSWATCIEHIVQNHS